MSGRSNFATGPDLYFSSITSFSDCGGDRWSLLNIGDEFLRSACGTKLRRLSADDHPSSSFLRKSGEVRVCDRLCGDIEWRSRRQLRFGGAPSRPGEDHRSRSRGRSSSCDHRMCGLRLTGDRTSPSSRSPTCGSILTPVGKVEVAVGTVAGVVVVSSGLTRRTSTGLDEPRMERGARGTGGKREGPAPFSG